MEMPTEAEEKRCPDRRIGRRYMVVLGIPFIDARLNISTYRARNHVGHQHFRMDKQMLGMNTFYP
jgi:hypothetical protein